MGAEEFKLDTASGTMFNVQAKETQESLKKVSDATKNMSSDLSESFKQISKALEQAVEKGGNVEEVFKRISSVNEKLGNKFTDFVKSIEEAKDKGASVEDIMKATAVAAEEIEKQSSAWSKSLYEVNSLLQKAGANTGEIGKMFADVTISVTKLTTELPKLAEAGTPGWLKIISMVADVVLAITAIDKPIKEMNRTAYDVSASMGQMGEKAGAINVAIGNFVKNYSMAKEEVNKIVAGLDNISSSEGELVGISEQIINRYTVWSELTPEFQTKMMVDHMKNFGGSLTTANTYFNTLLNTAKSLKGQISGLDIKEFMGQAHQISITTAQWGYNAKDTQNIFASIVAGMKDIGGGVDLLRAGEITQAMMGYGIGNLPMMSYMGTQYGTTAEQKGEKGIATQVGAVAWASPQEMGKMQKDMLGEMVGVARGGEGLNKESLTGAILIAQDSGMVPKMSMESTKKMADLMDKGKFEEAYKIQDAYKDSGVKTANLTENALEVAKDTKSAITKIHTLLQGWFMKTVGGGVIKEMEAGIAEKIYKEKILERGSAEEIQALNQEITSVRELKKAAGQKVSEEDVKTQEMMFKKALERTQDPLMLAYQENMKQKFITEESSDTQTKAGRTFRVINKTVVEDVTPTPNPKKKKREEAGGKLAGT